MPQIKEYRQQTEVGNPIAPSSAVSDANIAGTGDAVGLQNLGKAVSDASDVLYQRVKQDDVTDVDVKMAQAHSAYTEKMNGYIESGDSKGLQTLLADYDSQVATIRDNASTHEGKSYFDRANATLRSHFLETSIAGQSVLAGEKARTSYTGAVNAQANAVFNNPSSLDTALQMQEARRNAIVKSPTNKDGQINYDEGLKLNAKTQAILVESAVKGASKSYDFESARHILTSGKYDTMIDGAEKDRLLREIRTDENAKKADELHQYEMDKKRLNDRRDIAQGQILKDIYDGKSSIQDILRGKGAILDPDKQETMMKILTQKDHDPAMKDANLRDVIDRINLPDEDPKKISSEDDLLDVYLNEKKINFEQLNLARGEFQGKHTIDGQNEETLKKRLFETAKSVTKASNDLVNFRNPEGDENYAKFTSNFLQEYQKKKSAGVSYIDLLTPGNPEYLGKLVDPYRQNFQQILQKQSEKARAAQTMTPESIGKMDLDSIKKLDNSSLNPAQREAAKNRYNYLIKGGK